MKKFMILFTVLIFTATFTACSSMLTDEGSGGAGTSGSFTPGSFTPATFGMSATLVIPHSDYTTNTFGTDSNLMNGPINITSDGKRLFIVESGNRRVLAYNTLPISNGASADYVLGKTDFTTNAAGTTASLTNSLSGAHTNGTKFAIAENVNNRILIYNSIPTSIGQAADVVVGQSDFISSGSAATQTGLNAPRGVFLTDSKMIVVDSANNRVLLYNSIPTTNGAAADVVLGQADFTSNLPVRGGTVAADTLRLPGNAWSDGTRLIVTDYGSNRVLIWNTWPTTNGQAADMVLGQADFTSEDANRGGGATAAQNGFWAPYDIAVDGSDRIIISERYNNRIVVYTSWPTNNGASPDAVIGQTDWTSNGTGTTQSTFNEPYGICVDSAGNLWVADLKNHRVLRFTSN